MSKEKREVNFELLKNLIEEAGLTTADLISKIAGMGGFAKCASCESMCVSCLNGCNQGPDKGRVIDQYIIYPHEFDRLKKEILAALKE